MGEATLSRPPAETAICRQFFSRALEDEDDEGDVDDSVRNDSDDPDRHGGDRQFFSNNSSIIHFFKRTEASFFSSRPCESFE